MSLYSCILIGILCLGIWGCDRSATNATSASPPSSKPAPATTQAAVDTVVKSEEEWKKLLTPEEYRILREKGTERAFTGKYDKHYEKGAYLCAGCGLELFTSETKFDSGCGWPAFYAAKAGNRVKLTTDRSHGMVRVEVTCARCDGHLGHVFDDAPDKPTGQRFCINSVSIRFVPAPKPAEAEKKP